MTNLHGHLIQCRKAFNKIQPLHDKVLERLEMQETYLNIGKAVYSKPIANTNLNGEKLKVFSLKSGTRHDYPLSPYLEVLSRGIRQLKEIKGIQIEKRRHQSIVTYRLCDNVQ